MEALNKNQSEAANHFEGPMLVVAGPGSGKTLVIAHRINNLIQKYSVAPQDILVITYTKSSALDMKKRFMKLTDIDEYYASKVTFGTFHSYFYRIIRSIYGYSSESIISDDEKKRLIAELAADTGLSSENFDDLVNSIMEDISLAKSNLCPLKDVWSRNCSKDELTKIIIRYEAYKDENNKLDFDDMLTKCYKALVKYPDKTAVWQKKFCLIDEFQDINKAQYECIKILSSKHRNLFAVGDDDQSIYQFRGSKPEFILNFRNDFPDAIEVCLDVNYRSTDKIIAVANKCINFNKQRIEKTIKGVNASEKIPILLKTDDVNHEALTIAKKIKQFRADFPYCEMAVIYRTNIQARAFIDCLRDLHIPFTVKDEIPNIYDHWINKDLLAYMRLSMDNSCISDLIRIINKPSRYISNKIIADIKKENKFNFSNIKLEKWQKKKIQELMFYLSAIKGRTPYEAIRYIRSAVGYDDYIVDYSKYRKINSNGLFEIIGELMEHSKQFETFEQLFASIEEKVNAPKPDVNDDSVTLTTLHSAKGLEFELVFIASAISGVIPHEKCISPEEIEEERRLFYVGITRAKKHLYISYVKNRYEKDVEVSEFVNEIL